MQYRNYVVSMSRQTYGYGVAFHLTGDPRYLRWAKAGVDYLRANAFDKSGGTFAYWDGGARVWGPEPEYRNPQELAHALLVIGFYCYLTRELDMLPDLLKAKDTIFKRYYNAELNALQWMLKSSGESQATDKKLVAQLDQLNAYMVLLSPLLPEPERTRWQKDMVRPRPQHQCILDDSLRRPDGGPARPGDARRNQRDEAARARLLVRHRLLGFNCREGQPNQPRQRRWMYAEFN